MIKREVIKQEITNGRQMTEIVEMRRISLKNKKTLKEGK